MATITRRHVKSVLDKFDGVCLDSPGDKARLFEALCAGEQPLPYPEEGPGWKIFDADGQLQVQRLDDAGIFENDGQAIVAARAVGVNCDDMGFILSEPSHQVVDFGPGPEDDDHSIVFEGTEVACANWLLEHGTEENGRRRYGLQEIPLTSGYRCYKCRRYGNDLMLTVSAYTSITMNGNEEELGKSDVQYDGHDNARCEHCEAEGDLRAFDVEWQN